MDAMVSHFEVRVLTCGVVLNGAVQSVLVSPLLLHPHSRAVMQKAKDGDCCGTALEAGMFSFSRTHQTSFLSQH